MEPTKTLAIEDCSNFLRQTEFIISNLFMCFYPIRVDRHVFVQVLNTIMTIYLCRHNQSRGIAFTWTNLPLRSSLAGFSVFAHLQIEANSRRAFAAEHFTKQKKAMMRQIRTGDVGGKVVPHAAASADGGSKNDWFEWGTNGEDDTGAKTKIGYKTN